MENINFTDPLVFSSYQLVVSCCPWWSVVWSGHWFTVSKHGILWSCDSKVVGGPVSWVVVEDPVLVAHWNIICYTRFFSYVILSATFFTHLTYKQIYCSSHEFSWNTALCDILKNVDKRKVLEVQFKNNSKVSL